MTELWEASRDSIRAEMRARIKRVKNSLNSLKNQDGEYAVAHRKLINLYEEMATVIDRHSSR